MKETLIGLAAILMAVMLLTTAIVGMVHLFDDSSDDCVKSIEAIVDDRRVVCHDAILHDCGMHLYKCDTGNQYYCVHNVTKSFICKSGEVL